MTDAERMLAFWKMQEVRCGYVLSVWTWQAPDGLVHLLNWSTVNSTYALRCVPTAYVKNDTVVEYNFELPTCVRCCGMMSPKDIEPL